MCRHLKLKTSTTHLTGTRIPLDIRRICLLGRAPDCDIKVPDEEEYQEVSRHHCIIYIDPPEVRVIDLQSKNGTFINDRRIGETPDQVVQDLKEGDEVYAGCIKLHVTIEEPEETVNLFERCVSFS
ncbi:MAG: FHA domain-containing protein [Gemmatales bacterium]